MKPKITKERKYQNRPLKKRTPMKQLIAVRGKKPYCYSHHHAKAIVCTQCVYGTKGVY
jgi:hypothetical protein